MNSIRDLWPKTSVGAWMNPDCEVGLASVIIPTYNRAQFIIDAMDSVQRQVYRPIELIVVDDGSVDQTSEVVRWWKQKETDEQLKVGYFSQPNRGAPVARNRGLIESRGEYIQFLDSDDLLHPQKISLQVQVLQRSGADFVFSPTGEFRDTINWDAEPVYQRSFSGEQRYLLGFLHRLRGPQTWSTEGGVYKRSTCLEIGPWNETFEFDQDWEYNIRLLSSKPLIEECNGLLSLKRNHNQGRVGTARQKKHGPGIQLSVVQHVEDILSRSELLGDSAVLRGLFAHYMLVIHSALKLNSKQVARVASKSAVGVAPSVKERLAALLFGAVSRIPAAPSLYRRVLDPLRRQLTTRI